MNNEKKTVIIGPNEYILKPITLTLDLLKIMTNPGMQPQNKSSLKHPIILLDGHYYEMINKISK